MVSLLRSHRNPTRHVRMKAAEIVHVARMFQHNVAYSLCWNRDIPILVSSGRGVRDEIAARPFDRVANVSRDLRGSNFSLSIVTRIVSLARAGVINSATVRMANRRVPPPTATSYFNDWATCSACCS